MLWLIVAVVMLIALGLAIKATANPDPFRVAAASLGLTHSRSVPELLPRLSGAINGLPVRIDVPQEGAAEIRYRVFYPDLGMALRLERETTIDRTLGALGSGDREVGAKDFDDAFRVNTSRPDALVKMLTPELRRRLVQLVDRYPSVVIADGEITLIDDAPAPTAETIVNTVDDLVAVAALLEGNRPPPLETPPPRPVAPTSPRSEPDSPPAAAATEPAPAQPQAEERAPTPPAEPKPEPAPSHAPVGTPPTTGLPDGFFDEVFGEGRLSFESDDRFEREIQGTVVNLSGTVKQSARYEDKSDVSPSSGTKVVATVARIDNDLYGKTDIDAVIYLAGTNELQRGESISFTGQIADVDAFMRNLVVSNARLTSGH